MDYIKQTLSCVRRNNGFILLFLALVVFAWFEVIAIEKTVAIPNLSDNPLIDESMIDVADKAFVSEELHKKQWEDKNVIYKNPKKIAESVFTELIEI